MALVTSIILVQCPIDGEKSTNRCVHKRPKGKMSPKKKKKKKFKQPTFQSPCLYILHNYRKPKTFNFSKVNK